MVGLFVAEGHCATLIFTVVVLLGSVGMVLMLVMALCLFHKYVVMLVLLPHFRALGWCVLVGGFSAH